MFNSEMFPLTVSMLWALSAAGMGWYIFSIAKEITYVTLADGRRQERRLPLLFRLLLPLAPNLTFIFEKPAFAKRRDRLSTNIVAAGFEGLVSATEMMALQIIIPVVIGTPWILFIFSCASSQPDGFLAELAPILYFVGPLLVSFMPASWLNKALKSRHKSIQRSLPFVLDLLTLSVEAGMDFMTAIQRNVERRSVDALSEELIRVVREIQLGKTRKEALRDMSTRVNLQDIRSVVSALVQADELGVSIGSILRIQSDQIRQRRFERAEKLANEAPVKMLGPLLFFIFPAVFLILLGPILYETIQSWN